MPRWSEGDRLEALERLAADASELRAMQCREWNADHQHQVLAGQARAQQFTPEYQAAAGHASFAAFSARWRAQQGLCPLSVNDLLRYVTPADICALGDPLPPHLQDAMYIAWASGDPRDVYQWLRDEFG